MKTSLQIRGAICGLTKRCILIAALFLGGLLAASAEIRVLKETAIPFTGFLSKADFDQRFPGKRLAGPAELDAGWYVIYEHAALSYYFGPILLESTGRDYLERLTGIVEAAVDQRPSITDYRLELTYEPSTPPDGATSPRVESPPPPPPPPPPSIWGFFRRLFGLG